MSEDSGGNDAQHSTEARPALISVPQPQPQGSESPGREAPSGDADEELTRLAIRHAFEETDQYIETVASHDTERISQLRRTGRAIARELGWKVKTTAVPANADYTNVVLVITQSTPLRDQAIQKRRERLLRDAIRKL